MPGDNLILNESEIKQITEELYKQNAEIYKERKRIEELLYRVSEGIYATDEDYKITLFNRTLERMLNIKAEDALGKDIAQVIKLVNEAGEAIDIHRFSQPNINLEKFPISAILIVPGKQYYVHVKVSIIETKTNEREYLITISDITQEKELEKEKDEFISITSHELKTPMSIIKSYLWMLQSERGGALTDKQKGYIEKAMKGTERMINLINDILKISRMEQGKMEFKLEQVDLRNLILESLDEFELLVKEKGLELAKEIDENIPSVVTDKGKVLEILMNLVSNATKYTDSGKIFVRLENVDENFIKLSVKDSGRGISPEETRKLFKKFQRLDNSYETMAKAGGTGLGLYIIKLYMSNLGGSIGVESEGLGKGSTFWISLPKKPELIKKGGTYARL